jgi:hypothetical protein
VLFCVLFFFAITSFWSQSFGADDFENFQELDLQNLEQQQAGEQGM